MPVFKLVLIKATLPPGGDLKYSTHISTDCAQEILIASRRYFHTGWMSCIKVLSALSGIVSTITGWSLEDVFLPVWDFVLRLDLWEDAAAGEDMGTGGGEGTCFNVLDYNCQKQKRRKENVLPFFF